jgi:hypothetical protein
MTTFKLRVFVSQSDISHGIRHDCRRCPVALAVRRAWWRKFRQVARLSLDAYEIRLNGATIELPVAVSNKIFQFDKGYPIRPFRFTLENNLTPISPVVSCAP